MTPEQEKRLFKLAMIGAERRHWEVGDDYIVYGDGHDKCAPHECQHPDCVLVRRTR
jgi:hypothetical protein